MSSALFAAERVCKRYGGLTAVGGVSFELRPGDLVGLIGPNGAGKTTCFNLITGADAVTSGCVRWDGREITGWRAHQRARLGIARTFQNVRLWRDLSVLDNVRAVIRRRRGTGLASALLRLPGHFAAEREVRARALACLESLGLAGRARERAGDLPYGEQRRLEIARALALEPRLLLLDEPAAGMNPAEKVELRETVRRLRAERRLSILLIEHDMGFVMGLCERIYVLDHGELIAHGSPEAIRRDPQVIAAYLGSGEPC